MIGQPNTPFITIQGALGTEQANDSKFHDRRNKVLGAENGITKST